MELKAMLNSERSDSELKQLLLNMHSFDIVAAFDTLDTGDIEKLYKLLSKEQFADVLAYLEPEDAAKLLQNQPLSEQIEMVENLEPDDAADIINAFHKTDKQALIAALDDDADVIDLINYKDETAGAFMNNDILTVDSQMDVKDITKTLIQSATDLSSVKTIFVVDTQSTYLGQITLKNLIRAKTPIKALEILKKEPVLNVYDDVDHIIKHMKHYGAYDIGVLDDAQRLVGVITTDDLFDIYRDEAVEDIEKISFLPDTDKTTNVVHSAFKRLPWLIILMFLSMPLALITSNYEGIISSVVILALFQPLLLDSAGNVAHQTMAVTLVGLTYKEGVSYKDGFKEALSGVISGFILGALSFIAAYILADLMQVSSPVHVSIVVSITLWVTVIMAPVIGFIVPITLNKLRLDPAAASGPFITTVIDILCLAMYFGLATFILGV